MTRTPNVDYNILESTRKKVVCMKVQLAGKLRHSMVNGPGVRYVVFFQGCPHGCPGCQNPETWSPEGGASSNTESVIADIRSTRYLDGLTLSGGDPLAQPEAAAEIAEAGKEMGLQVWAYSGWTFEQLLSWEAGKGALEALSYIDVLVDGPFQADKKSENCLWRGSTNQRLVDVPKSLAAQQVILYDPASEPIL